MSYSFFQASRLQVFQKFHNINLLAFPLLSGALVKAYRMATTFYIRKTLKKKFFYGGESLYETLKRERNTPDMP